MELSMLWIWFGLLIHVPQFGCLDIHLSETHQPGATLANVSIGPEWMYAIDRNHTPKFFRHFLKIEKSDGVLSLARKVDCTRLPRNPVPLCLRIKSLLSENFILLHFNTFVHGQNCFIKYKRKHLNPDVSMHLLSGYDACISLDTLPINVYERLPVFTQNSQMFRGRCVKINKLQGDSHLCLPHKAQNEANLLCLMPNSQNSSLFVDVTLHLSNKHSHSKAWSLDPWVKRQKRNVNSAPQFQLPNYQVSVPENEPSGTRVITLNAFDADDGNAGVIEYDMEALFDSRSNNLFQINPETGGITTLQPLDRELKDTHVFKVTATDRGKPRRSAVAYLTITVSDTNDHGPVFEQTEYRVSIRENVEIGFEVMTIRATDGDAPSNANMIYKIVNDDEVNTCFEIDPRNGMVKTRVRPDRELKSQYKLIVEANDQGKVPGPRTATATVHIFVEDENDNYPQFSLKRYVVQVPENVAVNSQVALVKATDKDAGNNAKVHYSIISGNVKGQFYIHSPTGVIDVIRPLDYEMIREYTLRVKAQDGGRPPLINSTGMVAIQVVDVNDNAPMFVSTPFQASVLENVPTGYSVIHIQAIDADSGDNAHLEYKLTDTLPGFPFVINNNTGWITVCAELDRETTEFYSFGVEARDQGVPTMSSSASVTVTILDVNDNVPTFTQHLYNLKVSEDVVVGTSVLTITAIDMDVNSVVTYQISSGNTRNRFAITSQSGGGLITLALPLDYKQERQYVLTITASDGTRHDTAQVFVNVTDANTHRPVFQSANYQVLVSEDRPVGSTVVIISATDEDTGENARITYVMEDNVPQFKIDPDTGAITTQIEIDYEDQASYTLAIIARDNGIPQKSDTTYVEIIVLDANDNAPQFLRDIYKGTVFEDAPVYTSVLQVSASDRDSGSNGRLSYTFQGGDDGEGDFFIEPYSGIIRTARKLDRENVAVYTLKAFAVDKGIPPLKAAMDIHVSVLDINDNAPVFEKDELYIYIEENSAVGSTLARVSATDPDDGTNAQILYQIVEGNIPEVFQLDIFSGDLIALTDLDYETKMEYVIVVQATSAPLVSRATVHVLLVDVNDNDPVLHDFEIIFNNYITNKSSSFPTGVIGKVPARDPDVSDKLLYTFVEGNELSLLILNQNTGELKLSKDLDKNRPLEATMRLTVSDGLHQVSALCSLRVTIITDDMLTNSITVRLENMSQERFLSPLLSLFTEGVAAVLSTSPDGVFVVNIQNDTDVTGSILNVTFSALLPGGTPGRYFPSEELQEQLYLNRTLLTLISTQRVLPFDDNICLREPCENYMKCVAVLKFDSTAPFVASNTVLFRPIHPVNGLRCRCPGGFTGDYCETEVDLCYSGPCQNNGKCRSREGGYTCECPQDFTGEHCEVNSRSGRCVPGVCKNGGRCVDLLVGGFLCQCPDGEYEKPYCEMTTRSFPGQSFITFRGLRQRFHFTLSFMLATREKNALLLYNGRFNERHDFIAIEIVEEQIQLTFSAGESKTTVAPFVAGGVSDGQWHTVHLHYYNKPNIGHLGIPHGPSEEKVAVVAVNNCDVAMALRFGRQIGNYTCAARGTQTGQKKSLDLTGPLLLGGVPNLPVDFPVLNRDFVGCIRNLTIDSKPIDMADFIANNGTLAGCAAKHDFCSKVVCQNGGVCVNKWNTHFCNCPLGYGGKNCEHVMPAPLHFDGHALVSWSETDITIAIPWYMGLMFRTRKSTGILLQASAGEFSKISLMANNRHLRFQVFLGVRRVALLDFPQVSVDDGEWHHVLVELKSGKDGKDIKYMALVSLDYGMFQRTVEIGNELPGLKLKNLFIGGVLKKDGTVQGGFTGCMQGVRMGETSTNTANINMQQAVKIRAKDGCNNPDTCQSNLCPTHSRCRDNWASHTCVCVPGYFGRDCVDACLLNPCEHTSTCVRKPGTMHGYSCDCGHNYYGQYCEHKGDQPCARGWWGYPTCGPCNCDVSKGFKRDCNKTTGECSCKENYYRPPGGDTCYPCDCFHLGAHSRTCDLVTGQCACKMGVVGRQCNRCDNPFAEVTVGGCVVVYDGCPKAFEDGIWWPRTMFDSPLATNCPKGSSGTAFRHCSNDKGWLPPELFNCTSLSFSKLKKESEDLHANASQMDRERSKSLAGLLHSAMGHTDRLFGNDIKTAYHLLTSVLEHESLQQGFELTATHDSDFNENIIKAGSAILDPVNKENWEKIQHSEGGTAHLLRHFEEYANTLVQNMRKTYLRPFTIVTDNMIVAVDYLDSTLDQAKIPRFQENRKVYSEELESSVLFPNLPSMPKKSKDLFTTMPPAQIEPTESYTIQDGSDVVDPAKSIKKRRHAEPTDPPAVVMVMIYRSLGRLLPESYDPDRRSLRLPTRPIINTPIVSVVVHREGEPLPNPLQRPITLNFRLLETHERTKPVCVYWNHSIPVADGGAWSSKGCELVFRNSTHISCQCNHMTSFAVLMDISKREHGDVLPLKVVTYTTVSSSLVALLITFLLLAILRKLRSNLHSIHKNLVAAIFLSEFIFLTGINQTDSPFICTVVAILLHYSYMCTFAWMFVEGLHIYRMLTEMRNINQGHMRFYYAIGWGIPAIITGLAVGLDPQGYGNPDFCWLSVNDTLIWSITGPISIVVLINIVLIVLAAKTSCGRRQRTEKSGAISALRVAFLLLLLISATWLLGLMAVNSDVLSFHYLFAILSCLQGVCIFFFHCVLNKDVRRNLKSVFTGKKVPVDEPSTTQATLLTRSLNGDAYSEDGGLYRTTIGESTVSLESSVKSGKSHGSSYLACTLREEKKRSVSSNGRKVGHDDGDSSLFFHKSKKAGDSDSDSELSVDEHSSLYASSHSSNSEDEARRSKTKWNNERTPIHSMPKVFFTVDAVSSYEKPYWPEEPPTASESEDKGVPEKLRVETNVNVELHQRNKFNHNRDTPQSESSPSQPNSNQLPRRGILKNKITYPPPLTDKNMKNRLREKLSDYNPPKIPRKSPSGGSNEGVRSGTEAKSIIIKPPPLPPKTALNGIAVELGTGPVALADEDFDSDRSNETSI
ncbi:cadherin EGF LAG seven-pass G-type receptor 1-like isoform X2 [Myxocyprinus asiaticus]|uniref:cadherin EGF LAG seven-pass G-type receptor 1-like isoform X2 n=1 Tax=Myxocyprinus asiaticus TaxID=70543 RepID=UPI002222F041|nr:cadherin EGF LAG seven-pass G-type receptor 1-like isoform X2 [Myxocyprinus asiaticus]